MGTVTGEEGGDAVEATSIGAPLFVYLFIYLFVYLFIFQLGAISATPKLFLFTYMSLAIIFYSEHIEHNLINKILLHHTISIILMASKIAEADYGP